MAPAHLLDLDERRRAVDVRLARAEQIEVRAVQDQDRLLMRCSVFQIVRVAFPSFARRATGQLGMLARQGTSTPTGISAAMLRSGPEVASLRGPPGATRPRLDDELIRGGASIGHRRSGTCEHPWVGPSRSPRSELPERKTCSASIRI